MSRVARGMEETARRSPQPATPMLLAAMLCTPPRAWTAGRTRGRGAGSRVQLLDRGPGVQPGCEAAAPAALGVGPGGTRSLPPPLLSADQSGRGSAARRGQSGAAGAAPGAGGRRASPESGSRRGAAPREGSL